MLFYANCYAEIGTYRRVQIAGVHIITFHSQVISAYLLRLLLNFSSIFIIRICYKTKEDTVNVLGECENWSFEDNEVLLGYSSPLSCPL